MPIKNQHLVVHVKQMGSKFTHFEQLKSRTNKMHSGHNPFGTYPIFCTDRNCALVINKLTYRSAPSEDLHKIIYCISMSDLIIYCDNV